MDPSLQYLQRATDVSDLVVRRRANEKYGRADMNQWILGFANIQRHERILDVACGDGKQLIPFAQLLDGTGEVVGLDISTEALQAVERQINMARCHVRLVAGPMEQILDLLLQRGYFDMVSCCYGLYYSKSPAKSLRDFKELLKPGGRLVIVGPDRGNNAGFYRLLRQLMPLPEEVQTTNQLMRDLVVPQCREMFGRVRTFLFQNPVTYPTLDDLLEYWHSTTFFSPDAEDALTRALRKHFQSRGSFTITKRAMGVLAC